MATGGRVKPYFSWRHAFVESSLSSTTKLVLHTLHCYMNEKGESCFPSIKTIAEDASLTERAVTKHITIAVEAGWIEKFKHGFGGQQWARNEYRIPKSRGEPDSVPSDNVGNVVPVRGERGNGQGANNVPTNYPSNYPSNSPDPDRDRLLRISRVRGLLEGVLNGLPELQQQPRESTDDWVHRVENAYQEFCEDRRARA